MVAARGTKRPDRGFTTDGVPPGKAQRSGRRCATAGVTGESRHVAEPHPELPPLQIPDLDACLWRLVAQIPPGRVTTYGALARALGDVAAARWIGERLAHHAHRDTCPCHRVVRSDGSLGLFVTGQTEAKASLLRAEGVRLADHRIDPTCGTWEQFETDRPLEQLRQFQERLPELVRLTPLDQIPEAIGGVDVSYTNRENGVAAYVLLASDTGRLLWSTTVTAPVRFPYVPGYLAFRELPLLLAAVDKARSENRLAEVTLVDGNGLLHHRRAGIATHLGVVAGLRTVGIGKKLLCGRPATKGDVTAGIPIELDGRVVGMAIAAGPRSRPIYVSPGQGIDLPGAVQVVRHMFRGHRVPEPLYLADKLSRRAAGTS